MRQTNKHRKLEIILFLIFIINMTAFILTFYMLTEHPNQVYESNPYTSFIIYNYGFIPMILVLSLIWIAIFIVFRIIFVPAKILMLLLISPNLIIDLANNVTVLMSIV